MCKKLRRIEKISKAQSLTLKKFLLVHHMLGTNRDAKVFKRVLEWIEIISPFFLTNRIFNLDQEFTLPYASGDMDLVPYFWRLG